MATSRLRVSLLFFLITNASFAQITHDWLDSCILYILGRLDTLPTCLSKNDTLTVFSQELSSYRKHPITRKPDTRQLFIRKKPINLFELRKKDPRYVEIFVNAWFVNYFIVISKDGKKSREGLYDLNGFLGDHKTYYSNGKTKWEGKYSYGERRTGTWLLYSSKDGKLVKEKTYPRSKKS